MLQPPNETPQVGTKVFVVHSNYGMDNNIMKPGEVIGVSKHTIPRVKVKIDDSTMTFIGGYIKREKWKPGDFFVLATDEAVEEYNRLTDLRNRKSCKHETCELLGKLDVKKLSDAQFQQMIGFKEMLLNLQKGD